MFTEKALNYLMKNNSSATELSRAQAEFREAIWKKNLLTAEQMVAKFTPDEIAAVQELLSSGKIETLHEYEPEAFSCTVIEDGKLVFTEIETHRGKVEDVLCTCKICAERPCLHIFLLVYYIANRDCWE